MTFPRPIALLALSGGTLGTLRATHPDPLDAGPQPAPGETALFYALSPTETLPNRECFNDECQVSSTLTCAIIYVEGHRMCVDW